MVRNNPSWGEERVASELLLRIGIQISPRTVRRHMPNQPRRKQSAPLSLVLVGGGGLYPHLVKVSRKTFRSLGYFISSLNHLLESPSGAILT